MDKKLCVVEIVVCIGLLFSIVLCVLVGKVNISDKVCWVVLDCVCELGVM